MLNIIPRPVKVEILSKGTYDYSQYDISRKYVLDMKPNSYKLEINEKGIFLEASDERGFHYGAQTVAQIAASGKIPNVLIYDEPRFNYRGFMLDCCRHFFTVEEIKKIIDLISYLKFNIFHWHLTEDQGWRIEISRYPLLTKIGSKRDQTLGDGIPVEGYYTKDQIREVVEYAKSKHIDIIPELDVPGHFSAAIAAYPFLSCDGQKAEVKECFGIFEDVMCAGKEDSYRFFKNVLQEVFELFPYEYIHLGGDEALRIKWLECFDCQKTIKDNNLKNEEELQAFMMNRLAKFCKENGRKVINWNDGLYGDNVSDNITVHYWRTQKADIEASKKHVNAGKDLIMSPFFHYYLDYPYGMTPLRKTFKFNPVPKWLNDESRLLGVEAPLWTEYVKDFDKIMYQTFPRLLAVAERGWSPWHTNYKDFETRAKGISECLVNKYGYNFAKFKEVNPRGLFRLKSLKKFYKQIDIERGKESLARVNKNKRMLNQKYSEENKK
ncbi:MAG: beta-N-acetylhexosaminidase [Christensenellales bacterium]|jgi:hexosaminidase